MVCRGFGRKLKIGGGKERMASLFEEPAFQRGFPAPDSAAARKELLASWHRKKSEIFQKLVNSGGIPARPSLARLAREALDAGWRLAEDLQRFVAES